jgi:ketosteroid isomerase-like protein
MSRRKKATLKSERDIVFEYFRRIRDKDVSGLLDLFTDDAVIYEPFSKSEDIQGKTTGLHGKQGIESFLGVVVMANEGLEGDITIDKIYEKMDDSNSKSTEISAIVTFERGNRITARFTFELISLVIDNVNNSKNIKNNINTNRNEKKIKSLHIQFTN